MYTKKVLRIAAFFLAVLCYITLLPVSYPDSVRIASETTDSLSDYDGDEIIILWSDDSSISDRAEVLSDFNGRLSIIENFEGGTLCKAGDANDLVSLVNELSVCSIIEVAEPNYELQLMDASSSDISNDYYTSSQWSLMNPGFYIRISGSSVGTMSSVKDIDVDAPEGWAAYEKEGIEPKEVIVAVIDTGIDYKHPDLLNCMWTNSEEIPDDGIDNDGNGYIDDIYGWDYYNDDNTICHYEFSERLNTYVASQTDNDNHGTHIAGVIAATADNGIGIAGIASNIPIKLMSLKIHNGVDGKGTVENAVKAIKYATMMGADICNMSWGTSVYSAALETAMRESDMLFVVAAGNGGTNNNSLPMYPASLGLDNVISTTFVDASGKLTQESNYGVSTVDIAAPGTDIFSTIVGSYSMMSGSSMAVPHVVAIAAVLYSVSDGLYPSSVKELIIDTLKPLDSLDGYVKYPGIPSLYNAIVASERLSVDNDEPTLSVSSDFDREYLKLTLDFDDFGGSGLRIIKYAYGIKTLRAFRHGTAGITVSGTELKVAKAGSYTFYISDYVGNETLTTYVLTDDTIPPAITLTEQIIYENNLFSLLVDFNDSESGLKQVKLLPGEHSVTDFLSADSGDVLTPVDDRLFIRLEDPGTYTLFASDYRGNKSVHVFEVEPSETESVHLTGSSTKLPIGSGYMLHPVTSPARSTDSILFTSSDESVAMVNRWGYITAVGKGEAVITIQCGNASTVFKIIVP